MKRLTNLLTLFIFLGSNFIAPLSYAQDDLWINMLLDWLPVVAWDADTVVTWNTETMVTWNTETMVIWDTETIVTWDADTVVTWNTETMVTWDTETIVTWDTETVVTWSRELWIENDNIESYNQLVKDNWLFISDVDSVECYYSANEDGSLWFNVSDRGLYNSWANCNNTVVEIPDWVTKIWSRAGSWMFHGVTSIVLPDSVAEIEEWWLAINTLESVVLWDWIKKIWNNAFQWTKITSIDLKNVEEIWNMAFNNVSTLNDVMFWDSLKEIWVAAFSNTSLESINISSIKKIWMFAFTDIPNLKQINIDWEKNWWFIEFQAFRWSPSTSDWNVDFKFWENIVYFWDWVFMDSKANQISIEWSVSDGEYEVVYCKDWNWGANSCKTQGTYVWYGTKIWDTAFQWTKQLEYVHLWEWVTSIGYSAFVWSNVKEAVIDGNDKYWTKIWNNAFTATPLEKVTLWTWITTLWEYSFMNTKIESIDIPWTVKSIETAAFRWVNTLKAVSFGYWLERIWNSSFIWTSLESIDIAWSDTWTIVEHEAFLWITWVTHLTISWVREIQQWAFSFVWENAWWIENVVEISWTDKYETIIASWAFFHAWIKNLIIWENVPVVWQEAFADNKYLETVDVIGSNSGITISTQAFRGAWKAVIGEDKDVNYKFGENVTYLWDNVFQDSWVKHLVISWTMWDIPRTVRDCTWYYDSSTRRSYYTCETRTVTWWTLIGVTAFQNTKQLEYVHLWEWVTSVWYSAFVWSNVKEAVIDGNDKYWTVIDHNAFSATPLEKITLWTWITNLWAYSFMNTKIESINIPWTVKSIETAAFNSVKTLKSVSFGYWLERIWNSAFVWTSLKSIDIAWSDTWTIIEHEAFLNATWLTHLSINWVKEIQSHAFQWVWIDKWIEELVINWIESGTIIRNGAFRASWIRSLILWTGVVEVWNQSFENADLLENIVILGSDKWTKIGEQAFHHSDKIENVELWKGVDYIWYQAFADLKNIKTIIISGSDSWTIIGTEAFQTNKLEPVSLTLWDWVKVISWAAFRTLAIDDVIIPDTVEYIWDHAFLQSKVKTLSIWSWIKYIWRESFGSEYLKVVPMKAHVDGVDVWLYAFTYNLENPAKLLAEYDVSLIPEDKLKELLSWWAITLQWYRVDFISEWSVLHSEVFAEWFEIILPDSPVKQRYSFEWWDGLSDFKKNWKYYMPWHKLQVFAVRKLLPSSVSSKWKNSVNVKNEKIEEEHNSANDEKKEEETEKEVNIKDLGGAYSQEFQDAYQFAKENWITTKDTVESAQMDWKLTRIAMAKMLSQYAINVLWKAPDTSKTIKFKDVTSKKDADYDNGVTLAYQLWIMWQNMPNNKFRPNDEVSRAEFVTALSRLLYQTTDGEYKSTSKYYTHHIEKLEHEWIITNVDPGMKERRWYVMIMLMRSAK